MTMKLFTLHYVVFANAQIDYSVVFCLELPWLKQVKDSNLKVMLNIVLMIQQSYNGDGDGVGKLKV